MHGEGTVGSIKDTYAAQEDAPTPMQAHPMISSVTPQMVTAARECAWRRAGSNSMPITSMLLPRMPLWALRLRPGCSPSPAPGYAAGDGLAGYAVLSV